MDQIHNPLTDEELRPEAVEFVTTLRKARAGARKAARSGNPAVAGPARKALRDIPGVMRATYMKEAHR